ncbi:unnamed protein product [Ostreobium quekettii]|uniref:NADH:ubiquinone oxidoreductase intermediate-associated protein 30 domain-containing protein n=1 Tax=Ostreobium quekettii TaxID=121088 RepID=A0A8S1IQG2_9CHLO|nr:unnamed protein product [Ostreobium quekettii]
MEDPERVDAQGNVHLGEAAIEMLPHTATAAEEILNLQTQKDVEMWERLDDVIMGGKSSSSIKLAGDGSGAVWSGDLVVEGGGFCGCRISLPKSLDLSMFDGVEFTAKGNGSIFKLNLATAQSEGGKTYQASFETVEGAWTEVKLPWHEFVPVDQAMYEPGRPPADPSNVVGFTLVYSRFTHNRMPNPKYSPGPFEFEIKGGISVFRDPRPQIVLVSSGALERSALIGDDAAAREKEIPIVQMNPKGLLDWKYAGENAIRATGLPYTVVRPCGLKDDGEMVPNLIEGDQGDQFRGTLTFGDVADVVVRVLDSPAAAYKTFEIRRSNDPLLEGRTMSDADYRRMFLKLALDRHRPRVGLPPFPPPYMSSPPAPTDSELEQTAKGQDNVADTEGQGEDSVTKVSETANATS